MKKGYSYQQLRTAIHRAYKRLGTWQRAGEQFGIGRGLAYRIVNEGYDPKTPHLRATLGLPALAPAPVCPKCGQVHVTKRCTAKPRMKRTTTIYKAAGSDSRWCRNCHKMTGHVWDIVKGRICGKCKQK